ncbi:MAG: hypothetical protein R3B48_09385 [Kofleriaceae bacterium]
MKGTGRSALLAGALALVACAGRPPPAQWQSQQMRKNEITALWTQIRDWRREAGMGVDPSPTMVFAMSRQRAPHVERTCPAGHTVPATCGDICNLAEAICDNAESICSIAAELGDDPWATGKCDNAKASCKEAQQRCCDCSEQGR